MAVQVIQFDMPDELLRAVKLAGLTQKGAFGLAVRERLPALIRELERLRLVAPERPVKSRPRKIDPEIWQRLGEAAERLDVSRPALLRACLRQLLL
jgi:hypothetical protein